MLDPRVVLVDDFDLTSSELPFSFLLFFDTRLIPNSIQTKLNYNVRYLRNQAKEIAEGREE